MIISNHKIKYFIVTIVIFLAFVTGFTFGKSDKSIQWLGWPVYGTPNQSGDPGIMGSNPIPEKLVRKDIEIGLREDGVVVWRKINRIDSIKVNNKSIK